MFCLHTAATHDDYDPLQVSQWRFYVANRSTIATRAGARMGIATLERICGDPVTYPALAATIAAAASSERKAEWRVGPRASDSAVPIREAER